MEANTSAPAEHRRLADAARPEPLPPVVASVAAPMMQTLPVEAPVVTASRSGRPVRIALLLPLRSASLGAPAQALRAGFMAAYERDRDGFVVNVVETGDSAQEILDTYAAAIDQNDMVVGPLARSAVAAVASSPVVSKPTLVLSHPEVRGGSEVALPQQMLVLGLSIEDEARQVARWASEEQPNASAVIISGTSAWQRRLASAFGAQWKQLGLNAAVVELPGLQGFLGDGELAQLKARIESEAPALLFAALDAEQLRQVRTALGLGRPVYGASSVNPGNEPGAGIAELDGVRFIDLPWEVQPDHSAVMVYPRWSGGRQALDMDRLYALGIDAFRVAREISLHPSSAFKMDGVTGRLSVSFGLGPSRFERTETPAVYQGGAFQLVGARR